MSTQIMCTGKIQQLFRRMKQNQGRRTRTKSSFLIYTHCYNDDFSLKIIPNKGLGLQVTNHKNYPFSIFKKLGSTVCLELANGNFHFTCEILGNTDLFQ